MWEVCNNGKQAFIEADVFNIKSLHVIPMQKLGFKKEISPVNGSIKVLDDESILEDVSNEGLALWPTLYFKAFYTFLSENLNATSLTLCEFWKRRCMIYSLLKIKESGKQSLCDLIPVFPEPT